jgi:hypothetical protein
MYSSSSSSRHRICSCREVGGGEVCCVWMRNVQTDLRCLNSLASQCVVLLPTCLLPPPVTSHSSSASMLHTVLLVLSCAPNDAHWAELMCVPEAYCAV